MKLVIGTGVDWKKQDGVIGLDIIPEFGKIFRAKTDEVVGIVDFVGHAGDQRSKGG